ncbi:MAG: hypothetical protein E7464_05980 [Ruminococcaceae bacterium]|nr:hypothetical protein [Oscillospiraceae bacterium]
MFCKWCGETVKEGEKRCPKCLRELPPLSECGGFYNLYKEQPKNEPLPQAVPASAPERAARPSARGKKHAAGADANLWRVVCAVLAILCLFNLLRLGGLNRRIKQLEAAALTQPAAVEKDASLEKRIAALEEELDSLGENTARLISGETMLESSTQELSDKITALEAAVEALSRQTTEAPDVAEVPETVEQTQDPADAQNPAG